MSKPFRITRQGYGDRQTQPWHVRSPEDDEECPRERFGTCEGCACSGSCGLQDLLDAEEDGAE